MDDLKAINDGGERRLERSFKEIYPPEIKLKKESNRYFEGPCLDLGIKIEHKKFIM